MATKLTQEEAEAKSLAVGIKMIGKYVNNSTKIYFECPDCKQLFKTIPNSIWCKQTLRCMTCSYNIRGKGFQKDITNIRFGSLVAIRQDYQKGDMYYWLCRCDCNRIKTVRLGHLTSGSTISCGLCNNKSRGNNKIYDILSSHNIEYEPEKVFKNCRDKRLLPFDCYIPSLNICIEYQGEHHYVDTYHNTHRSSGQSLQCTKRHDRIKRYFCEKHDIRLITIKYTRYDKIEDILVKKLNLTKQNVGSEA